MNTRKAWARYRNGDRVTTREMEAMLAELNAAIPLLNMHPDMGAARFVALIDRSNLEGYLKNRKSKA